MSSDVHPSLLRRKIIHFDMDAFYAAIEMRDDPSLAQLPLVIGGSPNSRAVVCTANYEARRFGIKSAMSCARAQRLCPRAVFLPPNFSKYRAVSQQIRSIFHRYTAMVEPLSLDEAFLDVTANPQGLYAVKIAKLIQDEVYEATQLTGSAGVAPNKLLAKIASDMHKPRGLTVILPKQALSFMETLPLRRIHGIGPATEARLLELGLKDCRDVWALSLEELTLRLGNRAGWLAQRSRGIDERPVQPMQKRKSLGKETTFEQDLLERSRLEEELENLIHKLVSALDEHQLQGRTITLKVKYADFSLTSKQHSLDTATGDAALITHIARLLLRQTAAGARKIRLLGISLSNFD